jgi:aldehyde dehydrogenase (NAD+)
MTLNIEEVIAPLAATYKSGANQTLKWRLHQLNSLLLMINEREEEFIEAMQKDLHKERTESKYSEIILVKHEIKKFKRELKGWMEPTLVSYPGAIVPSS